MRSEHLAPTFPDWAAATCAAVFVVVLAIAAYWDPSIRVLHAFEAIPYIAAAALCLRRRTSGYALGVAAGGFWLWMASVLTTFVRNGFEQLFALLRTGSVGRADVLIAAPAAMATAGLVVFSLAGYRTRPGKSLRDLGLLAAALLLVPVFFIAIFFMFMPRYLEMFRRLLR